MDTGYPKLVERGFPGITGKITAAFQYRGQYFYKHSYPFEYCDLLNCSTII